MSDGRDEMVSLAIEAVMGAGSVQHALDGLVAPLRDRYALWNVSIWAFEPEDTGRCLACWAPAGSLIQPGMTLRYTLTPEIEEIAHALLRGRAMLGDLADRDLGLLRDIVRKEGVRSFCALPLKRRRLAHGAIILASAKDGAFKPADLKLLHGITKGASKQLTALMGEGPSPKRDG